ncbi:MAG TPA: ABC transporter transmembrane domain-containing protein [Ktedonobacteraceae bacterium]|nr:ABC transporter transmembrane domain-containing protein [Ktedonobacteraceae bacterium]
MFSLLHFLYRNFKGYRYLVLIAVIMAIVQVGADLLATLPFKFISDKIQKGSTPAFLDGPLSIFDQLGSGLEPIKGHTHTLISLIFLSALILILCGILSAALSYIQLYIASFMAQHLSFSLRIKLFEHLQRLSLDWHGQQKKGDLVQRITGDIANIEKLVIDGLVDLFAGTLTILGVIIVMIVLSARFTLLAIVVVPILATVIYRYTTAIKAAARQTTVTVGQVANVAAEDIGAITVIKAFTREEREALRFTRYVDSNHEAGMRAGSLQAQFTPIVNVLVALGTTIIVSLGAFIAGGHEFRLLSLSIPAKSLTIGDLAVFLSCLKLLYQPIRDISKLTAVATNAAAGAERIQEVLDQAPEVLEYRTPYFGPQKLRGEINFENVVFGYTKGRPVLQGINLHIQAGKKVALVGLSGGGKTTLVKLIPRFYEVQQGHVKIDGMDNRMYPLALLRQNVSMVLQDSVLFEGTIRDNIEIGRPGASDTDIIAAAQKAHIHETIMNLPYGYETKVSEQGKNFSGGQRQRLAIARAILRDAPILILDEPTASLDVEAEAEVMHALDTLVAGRTVLMISHRLNTLGNVDEIIVLKNGHIVEQGSYQELKRLGRVFARLLTEQGRYSAEHADNKSLIRSAFAPPVSRPRQLASLVDSPTMPLAFDDPRTQPMSKGTQHAFVLIEVDGKIVGRQCLSHTHPLLTIGRLSHNDVSVPSSRVSRLHAKLHWERGRWVIEDAESLNGLVYQGKRIERLALSNGDCVYMAPTAVLHYKTFA